MLKVEIIDLRNGNMMYSKIQAWYSCDYVLTNNEIYRYRRKYAYESSASSLQRFASILMWIGKFWFNLASGKKFSRFCRLDHLIASLESVGRIMEGIKLKGLNFSTPQEI